MDTGFIIFAVIAVIIWERRRIRLWRSRRRERHRVLHEIFMQVSFVYVMGFLYMTFFPLRGLTWPLLPLPFDNTVPLQETIRQFRRMQDGIPVFGLLYAGGNIALFVPLGMMAPMLHKAFHSLLLTCLFGLAVSFAVEISQNMLGHRNSDVDDLIFNTIGAGIGYVLYRIITAVPLLRRLADKASFK
ncbi:hypothetical protein DNH61_14830 [Paenibacillus sambharensis]|uniref:VanZ-like domain-containing protein n=1 Tax=Paenibacillus sambharensis TaxID=1803190 RepID=A0A2W1LTX4_9BACL|nr:VanZ family protein [Paenibacillus sambharensis]PZD94917.1 hypothetical protein DNH61_14830 [Paenibacillus sambharensis]